MNGFPSMESIAVLQVCQEVRAESQKVIGTYERVTLDEDDVLEFLFNYEKDTIFLDPKASLYDANHVLPPFFPLDHIMGRESGGLKTLAVSACLWEDWELAEDYGSDVSCERCPGYGADSTHLDFKEEICMLESLETY